MTAKPRVYASRILEHSQLARVVRGVDEPELEHRSYCKEVLIREACTAHNVGSSGAIMIGDRAEDILGANRNGVVSVGVLWGYETREELEAAQPNVLVGSSEELVKCIRPAAV